MKAGVLSFAEAVDPDVRVRRAKLHEAKRLLRTWERTRADLDRARFLRALDELAALVVGR